MSEEDLNYCFICEVKFKEGDAFCEFLGGYAHWKCFDNQLKENAERDKNANKL